MISYHICSTPLGYAAILFQSNPFLVMRIFLPQPQEHALENRIQKTHPAKAGHTPFVLHLCKAIQDYFAGAPLQIPWRFLDLGRFTPLQRSVLETVATIPPGEVRSYSQIAAQIGRPKAYRFVGSTLARNPFPIFIPCHRVVCADGSLGAFYGGTALKKRILELEKR